MSKAGEIPYTWKQIEDQVREAILAQASILQAFGPWHDQRLVADYLCMDHEAYRATSLEEISLADLDISQHQMLHHVRLAYDYAYQIEGGRSDLVSEWHDIDGLLQGFPQTDAAGEPSPFCTLNDFPLRRVLETFFVRFSLFEDEQVPFMDCRPNIRELALLANMTVPAARTSLSKEGFKLEKVQTTTRANREDASFRLNAEDAKLWLSRRRGFIPQRSGDQAAQIAEVTTQLLTDKAASFSDLLSRLLALREIDTAQLAATGKLDQSWLMSLLAGEAANPDVEALRRLARALELAEPDFTATAVRHLVVVAAG